MGTSLVDRGLSLYREEGARVLLEKTLRKLYTDIYCKVISQLDSYTLTLDNRSVEFSTPTSKLVKRNRERFSSEQEVIGDFILEIQEEDVVYDVGANTGLYSLFAATECRQGKVVAFEPYPPNVEIFRQDIDRNKLDNIVIVESALSDSVGEVEFSQPEKDDAGYGSSSINIGDQDASITVPTTTGDKLVTDGKIPPPNVVKIDVEGAEHKVIEGMEDTLSAPKCRVLYCEVHLPGSPIRPSIKDFGSSPDELQTHLEQLGFTVERIRTIRGTEIVFKAKK